MTTKTCGVLLDSACGCCKNGVCVAQLSLCAEQADLSLFIVVLYLYSPFPKGAVMMELWVAFTSIVKNTPRDSYVLFVNFPRVSSFVNQVYTTFWFVSCQDTW